jgi:tRNA pseudouridine55 synthase
MSRAALHGFLNLDKPGGLTSRDVVDRVVRAVGRGVKVGHAGTLDPLASGVLVVAVGSATRLIEEVQDQPKVYRTTIRLGARSDTLDADGEIVPTPDPRVPGEDAIRAALAAQVGTIEQVPPRFSALKVGGKRAYDLARSGRPVELAARPVRVDRVELVSYAWPGLELEIACGGGTYIRSIARDIGEALGCGGLVEVLVRTRIGPFALEDAASVESLDSCAAGADGSRPLPANLRPLADAVAGWPALTLDAEQVSRVRHGQPLDARRLAGGIPPAGKVALFGPGGALVALGEHRPDSGLVRPRKVLDLRAE